MSLKRRKDAAPEEERQSPVECAWIGPTKSFKDEVTTIREQRICIGNAEIDGLTGAAR